MVKVPTFMGILLSVWVQENSFNLLGDFFPPTSLIYIQEIHNKITLLGKCDMDVI